MRQRWTRMVRPSRRRGAEEPEALLPLERLAAHEREMRRRARLRVRAP